MYSLTNLTNAELNIILRSSHCQFVATKMSRVDIIKAINDPVVYSGDLIRYANPVLDKTEIMQITDKRKQRIALEVFLKKRGKTEDYEEAIEIDGTFLKSIPIGRRNTALVSKAIDSGVLPLFGSIPKNFRQPKHALFIKYFKQFDALNQNKDVLEDNTVRRIFSYKDDNVVNDILTAFKQSDPEIAARLVKSVNSYFSFDKEVWTKMMAEHYDFVLEYAEQIFDTYSTRLPDTCNLNLVSSDTMQKIVAVMNKARKIIRFSSSRYYGSNRTIRQLTQSQLCDMQPWVTLNDVILLKDALSQDEYKRIRMEEFPQTGTFKAELDLLYI